MNDHESFTIRRVDERDRPALLALSERLLVGGAPWRPTKGVLEAVHSWIETSLESSLAGKALMLAACVDGNVVGGVSVTSRRHFSGTEDAYIGELFVADEFEGRGIGRALLAAAEEWAVAEGFRRMTLQTGAANRRARAFYCRAGYEEEEVSLSKPIGASTGVMPSDIEGVPNAAVAAAGAGAVAQQR